MKLDNILAKNTEFQNLMKQILELEIAIGYTGHSERTAQVAVEIAKKFKYDHTQQTDVFTGGCMHDVGKSKIDKEILMCREHYASGHPNRRELEKHVLYGDVVLRGYKFYTQMVRNIVLCHHKWYDGKGGYPDSVSSEEIPHEAQIISVADCFDAMIMTRPHDPARPLEDALDELKTGSGTQFNPEIIDEFVKMIGRDIRSKDPNVKRISNIYGNLLKTRSE